MLLKIIFSNCLICKSDVVHGMLYSRDHKGKDKILQNPSPK